MFKDPLELVTEQMEEYKKAYVKSIMSFGEGSISKETHDTHKSNLLPKIAIYGKAVEILKKHYGKDDNSNTGI